MGGSRAMALFALKHYYYYYFFASMFWELCASKQAQKPALGEICTPAIHQLLKYNA